MHFLGVHFILMLFAQSEDCSSSYIYSIAATSHNCIMRCIYSHACNRAYFRSHFTGWIIRCVVLTSRERIERNKDFCYQLTFPDGVTSSITLHYLHQCVARICFRYAGLVVWLDVGCLFFNTNILIF